MKKVTKYVFAMVFLMLTVAFVPSYGMTAYAKTYSSGTVAEVTNLQINDVLEAGAILHCPDSHALSLYIDGIWQYATNPYTLEKKCWLEKAISHTNVNYLVQVSTYFPNVDGVDGVTLDKSEITLAVGASETLTETVTPGTAKNKNVTWSSSDSSVATVENGVVNAVAEGSATITVTTDDGGYTATCAVTVKPRATGVSLAPTELSIKMGDSPVTLSANVMPANAINKNVTWSSSDDNIVTVDQSGSITAVAKGTAVITVTAVDGGFSATCAVTVTQPVTGVSLSPSELSMKVGNVSVTLTATVMPDNASDKGVTWSSSDSSVARVENGTVSAVGKGTAVITVTTDDGGFTATCDVTVTQPVTGVSLSQDSIFITTADDPKTLTATVAPHNASDSKVTWSSSDESVAAVDQNGNVTAVGTGTAVITVTTQDGGFTASCTVNAIDPATATLKVISGDKQTTQKDAVVFAFRFIEDTTDEYDYVSDFKEAVLEGSGFAGRVLAEGERKVEKGSLLLTIEKDFISGLNPGVYQLTVSLKSGGTASATFTVSEGIISPNTGDNTGMGSLVLSWILFLLSLSFIVYRAVIFPFPRTVR